MGTASICISPVIVLSFDISRDTETETALRQCENNKMTEDISTLNQLQEELKAADEKSGLNTAAFPIELLKTREILENNPVDEPLLKTNGNGSASPLDVERISAKRKIDENDFDDENTEQINGHEDKKKKKLVEQKCGECNFKCFDDAMMRTHQTTSHGGRKKMKVCQNCSFSCTNVWEMDFHCRSRGHEVKKEEGIPCKKCDYIAENKDDSWVHKKVHIPPEKLFECGDCVWCGDRLDNIRHHTHSQGHKMKIDYESIALAKAEAKGPKEVAHYQKKLAKDLKLAMKAAKS